MQPKKYVDTDFFLALIKESDWLKEKAKKILAEYEDELYATPFTIVELMIVCKREKIPVKETLFHISRIVNLESLTWAIFFKSCDYLEKGATIFDSLLMAFCENNDIISSDNVYQKFGFNVINLRD